MISVHNSFSFYFLLALITILPLQSQSSFFNLNQQVKKSNCSLSGVTLLRYYHIKCPATDIKINVILGPGNRTKIKCLDLEYTEFQQVLPNLTIGAIETVEIRDCPLPENKPISSIMNQLGISSFKHLIFNNQQEIGTNFNKIHFKEFKTVRNLTLVLDSITTMPDDLFNDISLKSLQSLEFYSNIRELPYNAFINLENVALIALGRSLNLLVNNIFRNQNKIIELNLSNNKLTNISNNVFNCNPSLLSLNLENNLIEMLPPNLFANLTRLKRLNLSGNKFIILPQNLLENNKQLTEFVLSNNRRPLKVLPTNLLADLPHLYEVVLESCGLEILPRNLFLNSKNIILLTISRNKLTELPDEIFQSQHYMKALNLSGNHLQHLTKTLLQNATDLEVFDVSYNNLTEFLSEIFEFNRQLKYLLLNTNRLTTENIRISFSFRFHQNLKTLDFSNNSISSISSDWTVPYFLEQFDLSYNNITILNDTDLINLIIYNLQLILTHNQITTIHLQNYTAENKYFQEQLLKIDLNNNPINCDCRLLSFVQVIKGSDKNYNLIENIQFPAKNLTCVKPEVWKGELVKHLEASSLMCEYKEKCPIKCSCSIRSFDQMLIIDCTNKNLLTIPNLPSLEELKNSAKGIELIMQHNKLSSLPAAHTPGYANVTKLIAANNYITQIEEYQLPRNLTILDIRNNFLKTLNQNTIMFMNNSKLSQVYLANNSWMCDCEAKLLLRFAQSSVNLLKDFSNMTCANTEELTFFYDLQDLCPIERKLYTFLFIFLALLCFLLALYYKYQTEIKVWLYAHDMCLWFVAEDELDRDKVYDAFISYSAKDEDFVLDVLLPELENGRPSFKLCVHVRDWLVGGCIPDQIIRSIAVSKKTIVVLSTNFLESVWAKLEFKAAHQAALSEGRAKVIVIIYEDIGNVETLDEDLKAYLKMNTYLKWGDPWFWKNLRYAMPHIAKDSNRLFEHLQMRESTFGRR